MIKTRYPLETFQANQAFLFNSIGVKGVIPKVVVFEHIEKNRYNIAFGDYKNGEMDDEVISNNKDLIKVMSTIAYTIYLFIETYPSSIVEIDPIDAKRRRLYNIIFQRKHQEVALILNIYGLNETVKERYKPTQFYQKFEIERKKK